MAKIRVQSSESKAYLRKGNNWPIALTFRRTEARTFSSGVAALEWLVRYYRRCVKEGLVASNLRVAIGIGKADAPVTSGRTSSSPPGGSSLPRSEPLSGVRYVFGDVKRL